MEIRRSKVKPCRAIKNKKIFLFVLSAFCLFLENKHFENHTHFTYLIKGTVLQRVLWEC